MIKAVYAGTFDPLTRGHEHLVRRAGRLFDAVVLGIAQSSAKRTFFTLDERVEMAREVVGGLKNVSIVGFSGLLIDFPVRRSHGATLRIRLDDGAPIPSGALVRVVGRDEEFPVGLEGEAYVTGLEEHNRLRATWKGASCELDVDFPRTSDPLPSLGTFLCHGVAR